ncbi:hypothetical protein Tco_0536139 [Tanacetum coccineum]
MRYRYAVIEWYDLVDSKRFSIYGYDAMLEDLGIKDGSILFSHFKIPGKSLDEGLHMMEVVSDNGKGVFIEDIVEDEELNEDPIEMTKEVKAEQETQEPVYYDFHPLMCDSDYDHSISGLEGDLETWNDDDALLQQEDPYVVIPTRIQGIKHHGDALLATYSSTTMSQLSRLATSANSILVKDMMVQLFETDNERDFKLVRETYVMYQELNVRCQERREKMMEMQRLLSRFNVVVESFKLLKELQDDEFEKSREMMKLISETQLKVLKKISFIVKPHRPSYILIQDRLPAVLDGFKVFNKNGIHPSDYSITFRIADNVPKHGGIFGDCGVRVCINLYRLAHGVSLDVDGPVDFALAYHEKMVRFNNP